MTKRHGYTRLNPMVYFNFIKKKAFLGLFSFLFFMGFVIFWIFLGFSYQR